jgi:hypothetical protein
VQLVRVSDGDSQPALRGQNLSIGERGKVVCKVANTLQRDLAISVLSHWRRESDYKCSVAQKTRHSRALTPCHDFATPSDGRPAIEPIPSVPGWRSR